ncbi:MAG TPA: hypothetical protein VJL35_01910 [Gemmatimonadaceae bacterium]|nr:hypothetical protein [Gemmatimonadaceae bacterium]
MRHAALTATAVAAVVVALVACEEQAPERGLTAPDAVAFAKQIGGQCDAARARQISSEQSDLWAKPALDSAKLLFALVTPQCSTASGKSLMLDYIQWTIRNRTAMKSTATNAMLLAHWNTVFPYVGYTGNNQPTAVPLSIFSDSGAVGVIDGDTTGELSVPNRAALTSYPQDSDGDARDHLFVIYPIGENCLTGTNLKQSGPCFQFSAFPHVDPKFSPKVKLGICQPLHDGEDIPLANPSLGHLDPLTRVTEDAGTYPVCAHLESSIPSGAWNRGFGQAVTRLAWYAKRALTPEPLYAVHGGLGGLGGKLSPFGAVDRLVFNEDFSDDSIGKTPKTAAPGTWATQWTSPGSILVRASLGNVNNPIVVLDQGGGNCAKCGGLLMQGNLFSASSAASAGIYDVGFIALQDAANMKEAVFVLRDSGGRDIARVTYAVRNNKKLIMYNDTKQSVQTNTPVGNWVQHQSDRFLIRVNLDTKKTTLYFNTVEVRTDLPFVQNATNLATISADFRGIDSGIMGWDDISIDRQADVDH